MAEELSTALKDADAAKKRQLLQDWDRSGNSPNALASTGGFVSTLVKVDETELPPASDSPLDFVHLLRGKSTADGANEWDLFCIEKSKGQPGQ